MPGKGKHRRPKSRSLTRGFVAAGTGGAALALPLMGATGANAAGAPAAAPQAPVTAQLPAQVPAALQAAPSHAAPRPAPSTYTVVQGDCLSRIAEDRGLSGGWQELYADNRDAVGTDPSLIHPGLELTLGDRGAAPVESAPVESAPVESTPVESAPESAPARPAPVAPAPERGSADRTPAQGSGTAAAPGKAGFVAPVGGGVSTAYRASGAMWSSGYHTGVDFIARSGTSVKAVSAGTVVSAGWGGSYGNEVVVKHADGHYSQYAHLSQLSVSVGQSVTAGQQLGLSGSTGNSTGPHLHFEIRTGPGYGSDVDPLAYLRSHGVSI
ncbi:peptidoglycan DD-metalloendopeptidase family protein [Streptomyces sp. NPDC090022]|uniref:M23 family metallopeptidase n=1 Tax=Streptomyces sp. NPDC090022 TaxID=3365920 RepID=UPI003814DB02